MIIEQLEVTKKQKLRGLHAGIRCEHKTTSTGTSYFEGKSDLCARHALFKIDNVCLCKQHAGDACLSHMIGKQIVKINFPY